MMGASHAISGAAVWVAITTPAAGFGILSVDPIERIAGAIVCAGAALLPDADHPNATIAYSVPGGSLVTGAIGKATGGHRKGMHSLLAVVGVLAAAIALSHVTFTPDGWDVTIQVGAGIMAAACIAFAVKVMHLARSWLVAWLTGIVAAGITSCVLPLTHVVVAGLPHGRLLRASARRLPHRRRRPVAVADHAEAVEDRP